jgi:polyisoprenoid-binding protein YceI
MKSFLFVYYFLFRPDGTCLTSILGWYAHFVLVAASLFIIPISSWLFISDDPGLQKQSGQLNAASFIVSGNCSLGAWNIRSNNATGEARIETSGNAISKIEKLLIDLPSESLTSRNPIMRRHAHNALRIDEFPDISYSLIEVESIVDSKITTIGNLTIKGQTKTVKVSGEGIINESGIMIKGSHQLRMTDFNIEPPVFALGMVRSEDEIEIDFEVTFSH